MPTTKRHPALIPSAAAGILLLLILLVTFRSSPPPESSPEPDRPRRAESRPAPLPEPPALADAPPAPRTITSGFDDQLPPTPVPPADPAAEFRIDRFSGRVIERGPARPLSGAKVTAYLLEAGNLRLAPNYPPIIDEVFSAADGRFRFPERDLSAGEVLAWRATLPGWHSMLLVFPAGEGLGDRLASTFQLMPAGAIAGRVVDEQGEPVANAQVGDLILGAPARPGSAAERFLPSAFTRSDAAGAFRLEGLELGKSHRIPVTAPGYVDLLSEPIETGREDVLFRLIRSDVQVRGVVTDWEGRPARGVQVSLRAVRTRAEASAPLQRTTATNGEGRFAFEGLLAGEYRLAAELPVPETLGPGCRVDMELALVSGERRELSLQLPGPARIEGRFATLDGEGAGGITLFTNIDDVTARQRAYSITSREDGSFAFTAFVPLDERGYEVRLPVDWTADWFPLPKRDQDEQILADQQYVSFLAVQPGEERSGVAILVGPGGEVIGQVLEPDGSTPAAEVSVFLRSERYFETTVTDGEGRFRASVPTGEALRIESASELGIGAINVQTTAELPPLTLVLEAYGILTGTLENDQGEMIAEQIVAVRRSGEGTYRDAVRFEETAMTTPEGTWRIENVAPGPLYLRPEISHALGYAPYRPQELFLEAGETREGIRIILEAGDYIEGVVLDDATGAPIPGATILTNLRELSTDSNEEGRFKLTGIPYDSALESLSVSAEGYAEETRRNVSLYDGEQLFRLRRRAEVELRTVDAAGTPIPAYRLVLLASRDGAPGGGLHVYREQVVNDPAGLILLDGLTPGPYRAEAVELLGSGASGRSGATDFTVAATGQPTPPVVVRVGQELDLRGLVLRRGTGSPVADAEVELLNPPANLATGAAGPGSRAHVVRSDGGGRFLISPVPAGRYRLRARSGSQASSVQTIDLGSESEPVELLLDPMPRLFGSLTSTDGSPVRRATIFVMDASGMPSGEPNSARDGRYEIDLPAPGTWQLAFSEDDTPNVITRTVTLDAGQTRELPIDFSQRVTLEGRIAVNGAPAGGGVSILLRSSEGEEALANPNSSGRYQVRLSPSRYDVWYNVGPVQAPTGQQLTVDAEPDRQTRDINVQAASLDVLVDLPPGQAIDAQLTIEAARPGAPAAIVLRNFRVDRRSIRFLQVPAGRYRGVLYRNGDPAGSSDWTEVRPPSPATMVLGLE